LKLLRKRASRYKESRKRRAKVAAGGWIRGGGRGTMSLSPQKKKKRDQDQSSEKNGKWKRGGDGHRRVFGRGEAERSERDLVTPRGKKKN